MVRYRCGTLRLRVRGYPVDEFLNLAVAPWPPGAWRPPGAECLSYDPGVEARHDSMPTAWQNTERWMRG
jgi:hypothetical protein